jgi:hypothetical protein
LNAEDAPKSSVTVFQSQVRYCTGRGSSSPHCSRMASYSASDLPGPPMAMAGSPGRNLMRRKVNMVTAMTTTSSRTNFLPTYFMRRSS